MTYTDRIERLEALVIEMMNFLMEEDYPELSDMAYDYGVDLYDKKFND